MKSMHNFDSATPASGAKLGASKRDTALQCRERAAADLLQSAAMINANQRRRMETSAATWTARAIMLQRVEDGLVLKAAAAKRAIGDEPSAEPTRF